MRSAWRMPAPSCAAALCVLWFGGLEVNAGRLTQGEVIALINYLSQILLALIALANLIVILSKGYASAHRIADVLAVEPSLADPVQPQSVLPKSGVPKIEFDHVVFCYPGAQAPSLSDCTVSIAKGSTVGLIGGTGAGKSSFVNLIPRFYDVQQGAVRVDGVDVRRQSMVRQPEILILDDSASALDLATDAALRQSLSDFPGTVLMISQRASTLRQCDQILVFEDGRIAGQGSHETLMAQCAIYREIVASQTQAQGGQQ